jgi:hypothetical protein
MGEYFTLFLTRKVLYIFIWFELTFPILKWNICACSNVENELWNLYAERSEGCSAMYQIREVIQMFSSNMNETQSLTRWKTPSYSTYYT